MKPSARTPSRLPLLLCLAALALAPAAAHSSTLGQNPRVYACTTDFHFITGPSSYPRHAAYGNGTCQFIHYSGSALRTEAIQVSWNGDGTTVCPPTLLDPVIETSCYTNFAVALNETFADGSTAVRNEIWHFDGADPNTQPGSVVWIYDSGGRFLGEGEGSLPNGSSFTWREYGYLL